MEIFARMKNEGDFEVVAELEENSINTKGLVNYYDFSDTQLVDRKLCMKIDGAISTKRDTYPEYTSFDSDWNQGTYNIGDNTQQTGYIDISEFNFASLNFTVSGEVLVESSEVDYRLMVGISCKYIKTDGTEADYWGGAIIGTTNDLKEKGWEDIFKDFTFSPGGQILRIRPWIQITKWDIDNHTHKIIYKNLTIEPKFETIEKYTVARYIKVQCSGSYGVDGDSYIAHNNLYQIEVVDMDGNNVALNKTVTTDRTDWTHQPPTAIVDGDFTEWDWNEFNFTQENPKVIYTIDLGSVTKIKSVKIYQWNNNTRRYLDKIMVSVDNNTWSLIEDSCTPLINQKSIHDDFPATNDVNLQPVEFSCFGESMNNCINSSTPVAMLSSFLDNAMIFNESTNTNIKWVLDNSSPTSNRMVVKMDVPPIELQPTASCRVETPKYTISQFNNKCIATAWVKVDKDYNGGTPLLTIEETPSCKGENSSYDMTKKGEWQKLIVTADWVLNESMKYFAFVRNIWNGNVTWTKGAVYIADLHFAGNPFEITTIPNIDKLYPSTLYKLNPTMIKNKGALYIEFDLNNFNNRPWMSFFHIYTAIDGDVENKKINLIFNTGAKQLQVRINSDIRRIYAQGEYKPINNRLCIRWGDDGIYSILNGDITKLTSQNVICDDYENFCMGCWDTDRLEANNNIYKLAIYDETVTNEDAIELTKSSSKFSLTDTVIETGNLIEGYNIPDSLYQTGFNYFQLADNFSEYHDKHIKLKNIYDYNNNAYFYNDSLMISPRYRNRWKVAFDDTEYSYKNIPNIVTVPTLASSNTSITISFIYNTHELTDEELNLNITCFTDTLRDTTKVIPLEKTGDIYRVFETTIQMSTDKNSMIEFSVTGQGYARLKNICICPVAYITHHDVSIDDSKKLGFSMNLKESINHEWDKGFTIIYKKKAICTSTLTSDKSGYIIDAIGSFNTDKAYTWFGKNLNNDYLVFGYRQSTNITSIKSNVHINSDLMYDWHTISIIYNPITKRVRVYFIFIDGSIEDVEWEYVNGYGLSYDELLSTVNDTEFNFDFTVNGWSSLNNNQDACGGLLKDLLIVKRSMGIEEIKELLSPLSLGVDSIRAGMELSERNIL